MRFASRQDAGRRLGIFLREHHVNADLVLGLPRGGVIVGAEVAARLQCALDTIVVRKIGHPLQREFAVGALAEDGVVLLNEDLVGPGSRAREQLKAVIREETETLRDYQAKFHPSGRLELAGKCALLVDDGLATGATAEAAVASARNRGAREIIVAVPVASVEAVDRLESVADGVKALWVDPDFAAVGRYYEVFPQTTDDEVIALLKSWNTPAS